MEQKSRSFCHGVLTNNFVRIAVVYGHYVLFVLTLPSPTACAKATAVAQAASRRQVQKEPKILIRPLAENQEPNSLPSHKAGPVGIGKAVIERSVDVAKSNNCVNLQWQTAVFNEMAIRYYEGIGGKAHDKKRFFIFT